MNTVSPPRRRYQSVPQEQANQAMRVLGNYWQSMLPHQRAGWFFLSPLMPVWDDATGRSASPGRGGYQCFTAVNIARQAMGLLPLLDAPAEPVLPPILAGIRVAATLPAASGTLTLTVHAPGNGAYPFPVQIFGGLPQLPGLPLPRPADCKKICLLPAGIPMSGAQIGQAYAQFFRVPVAGYLLPLRAVPLSPEGFRGPGVMAGGTVIYSDPQAVLF